MTPEVPCEAWWSEHSTLLLVHCRVSSRCFCELSLSPWKPVCKGGWMTPGHCGEATALLAAGVQGGRGAELVEGARTQTHTGTLNKILRHPRTLHLQLVSLPELAGEEPAPQSGQCQG